MESRAWWRDPAGAGVWWATATSPRMTPSCYQIPCAAWLTHSQDPPGPSQDSSDGGGESATTTSCSRTNPLLRLPNRSSARMASCTIPNLSPRTDSGLPSVSLHHRCTVGHTASERERGIKEKVATLQRSEKGRQCGLQSTRCNAAKRLQLVPVCWNPDIKKKRVP